MFVAIPWTIIIGSIVRMLRTYLILWWMPPLSLVESFSSDWESFIVELSDNLLSIVKLQLLGQLFHSTIVANQLNFFQLRLQQYNVSFLWEDVLWFSRQWRKSKIFCNYLKCVRSFLCVIKRDCNVCETSSCLKIVNFYFNR